MGRAVIKASVAALIASRSEQPSALLRSATRPSTVDALFSGSCHMSRAPFRFDRATLAVVRNSTLGGRAAVFRPCWLASRTCDRSLLGQRADGMSSTAQTWAVLATRARCRGVGYRRYSICGYRAERGQSTSWKLPGPCERAISRSPAARGSRPTAGGLRGVNTSVRRVGTCVRSMTSSSATLVLDAGDKGSARGESLTSPLSTPPVLRPDGHELAGLHPVRLVPAC